MASAEAEQHVIEQARSLINSGLFGDALVRRSGRIEEPRAVLSPGGGLHSWFVAVTVGKRLAGFLELKPDLTPMRYSSFQRKAESIDGCPEAASRLDPESVRGAAALHARPDERAGDPYLTYDRSPSRLVWAVRLENPRGEARILFVAGSEVYEPPSGVEDTFG
jgi:hypothetical protein